MQVVVDSLLVHYARQGKGKVVVLLHGWADSSAGLGALARELAADYDVIALDLPGFGGSDAPKQPWGLGDYAEFIQKFLKKLDVADIYAVIGHSNGGAMAIRGLANNTLRADKLVLLASAGIRDTQTGRKKLIQTITKLGKTTTMLLPAGVRQKLRRKVYGVVGSDMLVAEHMQETFKRVVGDDVQTDAGQLTLPTLLIYGAADDATPVAYGQKLHELIQHSKLEIVPDAGHFVHIGQPQRVTRTIREFLQ